MYRNIQYESVTGLPWVVEKAAGRECPEQSSEAQMRLMLFGAIYLVKEGTVPHDYYKVRYYDVPGPRKGFRMATAIVDHDGNVIAWRARHTKAGKSINDYRR